MGATSGATARHLVAADRVSAAHAATLRLAGRYAGPRDARARFLVDLPHAPLVVDVRDGRAGVVPGRAAADVVLRTDAATWAEVAEGTRDGIDAFLAGDLAIQGDLHRAVRLQTWFPPADPARPAPRALTTDVGRLRIASLAAGRGTPVVLLHGLGANLLSFLPTLAALRQRHEVHALDLPGFGSSDKPLPTGRRYHPEWMAERVHRYVVEHQLGAVHLVGNSMGGRIALELALRMPDSVRSVSGLCPAVPLAELRVARPLVRVLRGQWAGAVPVPLGPRALEAFVGRMFHDPGSVPRQNLAAAAEDAARMLRDRRYRLATTAAARHLGAEAGDEAFWSRLGGIVPPSLWLWGHQDPLVPAHYATRVRAAVPHAHVEVWDRMGHVPQFERPDETHALLGAFLDRVDAGAPPRLRWATGDRRRLRLVGR